MTDIATPQFTDSVDLRYFLEPYSAPAQPRSFLDRFPDALYNKAVDSHFLRFMYALLGPVGVGWLRKDLTAARLILDASGADLFNLEAYYGDPFSFGRILTESFNDDVSGLLPAAVWARIRAQDESYRSRAIQFFNGARLGNTPAGMRLAASSGTGQNVDVIENYRSLFDSHSDDPLGIPHYGFSQALGEFTVIPRPAVSRSEQQVIDFSAAAQPLGLNSYVLTFNGYSTPLLAPTASAADVQSALQGIHNGVFFPIGPGNVIVTGGPAPASFTVTFTGRLSNQPLPTLSASFTGGTAGMIMIPVSTTTGGIAPDGEIAWVPDGDRHHMQVALDYLRPVASYPTFRQGRGVLRPVLWSALSASSEFYTVARFVTGTSSIAWPAVDQNHWIEATKENEAPTPHDSAHQHYVNFHNVATTRAYTDDALVDPLYPTDLSVLANYNSVHAGPFPEMRPVMPYFAQFMDTSTVFSPDRALADHPEPLAVTTQTSDGVAFINDIYPADYLTLQAVTLPVSHNDRFWSSRERPSGAEILEIDLGSPQAVNFISLEVTRKPLSVEIDYDLLDQAPRRGFSSVTLDPVSATPELYFDPSQQSPWEELQFLFTDGLGLIFTRFIRLSFTRRTDTTQRFLFDPTTNIQTPWSIDVRNLRVGRNLAPAVT